MRVLHAAAEFFPFVKAGGLGDVAGALPKALQDIGLSVRILLPGFPALLKGIEIRRQIHQWPDLMGGGPARILHGRTPDGLTVYLLDSPFFDRPGGPYEELGDSHRKFAAFSWAAAHLARHGDGSGWHPQILHCHDWQTALAPVYLNQEPGIRPQTLLTIHNLAYQGIYPGAWLPELWLEPKVFHMHGVEYYGQINFLKGGLQFADRISTVSPTYAREIQSPEFGEGLDGVLRFRQDALAGILNGVDEKVWDPATSPHLEVHYDAKLPSGKKVDKNILQRQMGLHEDSEAPLFSVISRLAPQKGLDLVLANADYLVSLGAQLVVLGSGEPLLEAGFRAFAERYPGRVAVHIGYNEGLAHRILAGADSLLMPSRQEPCGLTQMYALKYGSLPVVRRTGGLADTVVDATAESLADGCATGFCFDEPNSWILGEAIGRAVHLFRDQPRAWAQVQRRGMKQDFGWHVAARHYRDLYASVIGGM
ncbi:MAG: starch synthase [Holophagaceae bacterium]|nr:starch synthase [Holophagaceae bacterium]